MWGGQTVGKTEGKEANSVLTALAVPERCHSSSDLKLNAAFQSMMLIPAKHTPN